MQKNHCSVKFIFVICPIITSLKNVKRMLKSPEETNKKGNILSCLRRHASSHLAYSNTYINFIFKS